MNKFMLCACGALLAGVSMAATEVSVTGNNTAVVVQKPVVKSGNGYQFLCVPVKGFDISGNGEKKVTTLGELLPPATMTNKNAQVTYNSVTYTLVEKTTGEGDFEWRNGGTSANDVTLENGSIFWLLDSKTENATVFCGEDNEKLDTIVGIKSNSDGMVEAGNAGSKPLIIKDVLKAPAYELVPGSSRLYVLKNGSNNYMQYFYEAIAYNRETKQFTYGWTKEDPNAFERQDLTEADVIAPGEAFYIQGAKLSTAVVQ